MTRQHLHLQSLTQTIVQRFCVLSVCLSLLIIAPLACAAEALAIDFQRDVQPILARKCTTLSWPRPCRKRTAIHNHEGAFAKTDSGIKVILPGKANDSELLKRVTSSDADVRMPPTGKPLTEKEIATLRTWIDSGAKWDEHWAFAPRNSPEVPVSKTKPGSQIRLMRLS